MSTVFTNGRIHERGHGSRAASVAVVGGRIAAIGDLAEVRAAAGSQAQEFDLQGGLLSAGFVDAHLHPLMGGLERSLCDLGPARSADECLSIVAEYARRHPEEPWIIGGGWRLDLFPGGTPTREALDRVVDRPVILRSADRHGAWVNTRALEVAGVTADTPDPADGRIERDAAGIPSGTLHEGAIALVQVHSPAPTVEALHRGLLVAQEYVASLGITGWQDALLRVQENGVDSLDAYLAAVQDGSLRAKVTGALWWDRTRGLEQLPDLVARRDRAAALGGRFRADSVKLMLDGIAENFSARLTRSYRDGHGHSTGNTGVTFIAPAALNDIARALDDAGFQMHFHALGDLAVREALDALEGLPNALRLRHHLAHLQFIQPVDVGRFVRARATANLQPLWAQNEATVRDFTLPFIDPALEPYQYPFGDLTRAGVGLAAGSDWPVSSANPIEGIHVAVNRSSRESADAGQLLPEQALPLSVVWDAYTFGSAWLNHRDDTTGDIRVGAAADLITLDRDPFSNAPEEIVEAAVTGTWIDGELEWQRGGGRPR
jgi:predicted amidohydrolase YtcJ